MKKIITVLTILLSIFLLSGCTSPQTGVSEKTTEPKASKIKPSIRPESELKIMDGSIYRFKPDGEKKIIIDKKDLDKVEKIISAKISPDKDKICFIGESMIPLWLYVADIDGSNINGIAVAKNCVWSSSGNMIAYNEHNTDVSSGDVYTYNINTNKKRNLTEEVQQEDNIRIYDQPHWLEGDTKIIAPYKSLSMDGSGDQGSGTSIINLESGVIVEK